MRYKNTNPGQLSLLLSLFLSACTVTTNFDVEWSETPIEPLNRDTADLADVAADVHELIEQVGKNNVLVVFDIDNTLLAMEQGLGADQWYDWQKDLSGTDPCNPEYVGDRFAVQGALYFASAMRRTQQDGAEQVARIQETGAAVIALTSRGMDYRLQTFRELRRNGFSFSYSAFGPPGGYELPFIPVEDGRLSLYEDGVFLTSGQHKGQMLDVLLKKTATPLPRVIVFADDKQKNIDDVIETFSAQDVPVRAWRYSGEDANVENFDTDKANQQWQSIEEALQQIQRVLGPDNYDLGNAVPPVECREQ